MLVQRRDDDQVAAIVSLALPDPVYKQCIECHNVFP